MTQARSSRQSLVRPTQIASHLAKLARPQNVLYPGILTVLSAQAVQASVARELACYLVIWCLYAVAASINNHHDVAIDRTNDRQDNPLVSGRLGTSTVRWFLALNVLVIGFLQYFLAQPVSIGICASYLLLLLAYSHPRITLQSKGYAATICLALCYGSLPILLGASQGVHRLPHVLTIAFLEGLLLAPLLLAKDYKDVVGDRLHGKRTPLVRYGKRQIVLAATSCLLVFGSLEVLFHQSDFALWVGLLVYSLCVAFVHYKNATGPAIYNRITQVILLLLTWRLLMLAA